MFLEKLLYIFKEENKKLSSAFELRFLLNFVKLEQPKDILSW